MPETNLFGTCPDKYKDKAWLEDQYSVQKKRASIIAHLCGCNKKTIWDWLKKHGIKTHLNSGEWNGMYAKSGPANPSWKGGVSMRRGYRWIKKPSGYPNTAANGYIAEHRMVMEEHLGRPLRKDETVHHLNGIKTDNRIENLHLIENRSHLLLHSETMNEMYRLRAENQNLRALLVALFLTKALGR